MWKAEDEQINSSHLAAEIFYVCRILGGTFYLLGLVRAGDTFRQVQYLHNLAQGTYTTLNPFWLGFNGFTALLFFIAGTYLWLEAKGPKVRRDNTKTAGIEEVLRAQAKRDGHA